MKKLAFVLCAVALTGFGCLPGSGTPTSADGGVFQSLNGGTDWSQISAVPSAAGVGTIGGTNIISMEMDPQDDKAVYIGTRENGMLYSLNGGASWMQTRSQTLSTGAISAIEVDPKNVCTVYVAKTSRVYKTTDCFRSLDEETYVESRADIFVSQIAVDWYNPQVVWIGLSNGDLLKSENGGDTWRTVLAAKKSITGILVDNADSRTVLVATASDGLQKSVDGGETWVQIKDELKDLKNANKVATLIEDATGGTVLAATSYGIIRSTDFGSTWTPLTLVTSAGQVAIRAIGMDPKNVNTIYYAAGPTFYRSTDAGVNWDTQKLATTRLPQVMLVNPTAPNTVYIGVAAATK